MRATGNAAVVGGTMNDANSKVYDSSEPVLHLSIFVIELRSACCRKKAAFMCG